MQRYDTIFNKNLVIRLRQRYDTIFNKSSVIRLRQRYDTIFNKILVICPRQRYDIYLIKNFLIRLGPLYLLFFIESRNFMYILQYGKLKFYNLILMKEGIFVIGCSFKM